MEKHNSLERLWELVSQIKTESDPQRMNDLVHSLNELLAEHEQKKHRPPVDK